jgi:hypothetical protein
LKKSFLQSVVYGQSSGASGSAASVSRPQTQSDPFPAIVALPRDVVAFLDEAAQGTLDKELWLQWLGGLRGRISQLNLYPLHGAEQKCLHEALAKLEDVQAHTLAGDAAQATEDALVLFRAMTRFEIQREKNRQSQLNGVNEFLISGLSFLEGNASTEVVMQVLPFAISDLDHMVELFKLGESHLPEEVKIAFLTGIERCSQGVGLMKSWDRQDRTQLRTALAHVTDGAGLLATLQTWKKESDQAAAGSLPVLGDVVQALLSQLTSKGRIDDSWLNQWHDEFFPQLMEFWIEARGSLLISTAVREPLIAQLDGVIDQLDSLEELQPDIQQRLLRELDSLFLTVSSNQMELSKLERSPQRWVGDLMIAIAAGGIPLFYLERTLQELASEGSEELVKAIQLYLETGDTDLILTVLEGELV